MQKRFNSIASGTTGLPVANATVQVNFQSSGLPATIYSDSGATQPIPGGTLTTDTNGAYQYYAPDGRYQEVISGANITTQTIADILMVDVLPADLKTTLPSSPGQLWNNGGAISSS
jgi:hypothetical protein